MSSGYLPSKDNNLTPWGTNFVTYASDHLAALGITEAQITVVSTELSNFESALDAHELAKITAKSARQAKDTAKKSFAAVVRPLVNIIQTHPGVTDAMREALGITVPKENRTPVAVPTARPDPDVKEIDELSHTLRIVNADTNKTAKPAGVSGVEIWIKVVPPGEPAPVDPDELAFTGFTTTSKFTRDFEGEQIGHTAYYRTRYLNTRGEHGPWGNQVSATIAA